MDELKYYYGKGYQDGLSAAKSSYNLTDKEQALLDSMNSDVRRVAEKILNDNRAQFVIEVDLDGNTEFNVEINQPVIEIKRYPDTLVVRNTPEDKWNFTNLVDLEDIFNWLIDVEAVYVGENWVNTKSIKLSDNFTKPETDNDQFVLENYGQDVLEKDLINRAFEKRGLQGGYGMDSDLVDAKDILQAYDDLNKDGQKIAKFILDADRNAQFIVLVGVNRSPLELFYEYGQMNVRHSPKGKWEGSGLDGDMEILEWIFDAKPTYYGERWPNGIE